MNLRQWLVVASVLIAGPAFAAEGEPGGVTLENNSTERSATLLSGMVLDATFKPAAVEPLRLMDGAAFNLASSPIVPLDDGGGVDRGTRPLLALLLGLIVGFGLGHLVARDREGFVLFLIIDLVIVVMSAVLPQVGVGWFYGLGGLALLVSHIIQGIDAYQQAGGGQIVQWTRERAVEIASTPSRETPLVAFRNLAFSF